MGDTMGQILMISRNPQQGHLLWQLPEQVLLELSQLLEMLASDLREVATVKDFGPGFGDYGPSESTLQTLVYVQVMKVTDFGLRAGHVPC